MSLIHPVRVGHAFSLSLTWMDSDYAKQRGREPWSYLAPFQRYCSFLFSRTATSPHSTRILGVFSLDYIADVMAPRTEDPKLIIRVINFKLV